VIPYRTPFYRLLASAADIEATVLYGDTYGVIPRDSGWGVNGFLWAGDQLSGYSYRFLRNASRHPSPSTFGGRINPGLLGAVRDLKPDAVLLSGYSSFYQLHAMAAAKWLRCKVLFTSDTNSLNEPRRLRRFAKRILVPRIYDGVDAFLVTGKRNREHYIDYGVDPSRLFSFPWSVDNEFFRAAAARLFPKRELVRAAYGIPQDCCCVLFAGRLAPEKDVASLIRVAATVPRLFVLVVGGGPLESALKEMAGRLLPGRHCFAGFLNQDKLPEAYAAADLLSVPSGYEPWGLTCNEAMVSGLPLVVSDRVGAAADLVVTGRTGWSYRYGDDSDHSEALAKAVSALRIRGDELRAAVRRRIEEFDYPAQVAGLRAALSHAIGRDPEAR
jgi:glycosyltransferase involved in cell wall biosynthesis